jgi:histidine ammonia-lyase
MQNTITIEPGSASLADWRHIYMGSGAHLSKEGWQAIAAAANEVTRLIANGAVIYGLNTGFGKLAHVRVNDRDLAQLQLNLVMSHTTGYGEPLSPPVVRLTIALKLASLGRGASGAQLRTVELLEALLERGVTPVVPGQGSVGASGDLAPLAHITSVLIGQGEAWVEGTRMPGLQALNQAGLEPITLSPKEGLALLNGTQVSTALALAGLFEIESAFAAACALGCMSLEAIAGLATPFDPRIQTVRGQPGQIDVAAAMKALLDNSPMRAESTASGKVQDPYSMRCQPQVLGACLDLMRHASRTLEIEANAASDNPLIFVDTGEVLSGGNFHAEPVAFAADMLALVTAEIGNLSERRTSLLLDPQFSGVPAFLTPDAGLNSGYMTTHIAAAAMAAENKQRAAPASIDTIPTSGNQEDHVSMATHAARRLLEMAANLRGILAIEALCAAQAIDMRGVDRCGARIRTLALTIRKHVPFMASDRPVAPDMQVIADLIRSREFVSSEPELLSFLNRT